MRYVIIGTATTVQPKDEVRGVAATFQMGEEQHDTLKLLQD